MPKTAIVIDDNTDNCTLFRTILENDGVQVTVYENPEEAFANLGQQSYDLCLLDLQMPILNGIHILRSIRPSEQHAAMKIIVITAQAQMVSSEVNELADFVMYKPISMRNFAQFSRRLLKIQQTL